MKRRIQFSLGEIYHICNKSISSYSIFRKEEGPQRFLSSIAYYNKDHKHAYSTYLRKYKQFEYENIMSISDAYFNVLSYCIMPDHYHLLLAASHSADISRFIGNVENSYTRFYNMRNNRKGPLWQSEFRCSHITTNEQLLHVSRYIHLNPVTDNLVQDPRSWTYSSYTLYLQQEILNSLKQISIRTPQSYEKFVLNNKDYQRRLKSIRNQLRDF